MRVRKPTGKQSMRAMCAPALLALGMLVAAAPGAAAPTVTTAQAASIASAVTREMARQHVPGIAVAVGRDGDVIYARGFGLRDVGASAPVDSTTVFAIGSITKQFTAAAVMQLVEAKKLRLDAPVSTYLAGIPSGDRITTRELLTHTSGLPNYTDVPNFFTAIAPRPVSPRALLALVADEPLAFAPGTRWAYSNTNYVVLGMLIEKIGGEPYAAYLRSHVIAPAGLTATQYSAAYLDGPNDALPYDDDDRDAPALLHPKTLDCAYAAGALWSTAPDLVRWQQALFSGRIVGAAALREMTTPARLSDGTSTGYGFGLFIADFYGTREIMHNGGLPGYSGRDAYFPDRHLEVAVLGNEIFDPGPIVRDVMATLDADIARRIDDLANATPAPGEDETMTARARSLLAQFQTGKIDRAVFDATVDAAFTGDVVDGVARTLGPLGPPASVTFVSQSVAGPYRVFVYRDVWRSTILDETIAVDADGKIGGIHFTPDTGAAAAPARSITSPAPGPTASSP